MKKISLCRLCLSRFRAKNAALQPAKLENACFICKGLVGKLDSFLETALAQSKEFEWSTFAVSTSFSKDVFVREEKVADLFSPGDFSSLKNSLNAQAISRISAATGKKSSQRFAEATFLLDFISGKSNAKPTPVYVYGHYLKFSRKHCQSRWHCSDCGGRGCESCGGSGQNYPSVEEEIGKVLQPLFGAASATLHACGREDVDVRMLGNGRPFVMELKDPKKRAPDLGVAEKLFAENSDVRAINIKTVPQYFVDAVCNSHFEKEYSALVSADRPLTAADAKKTESLSGTMIFQQTPKRVLARRADLERRRKVFSISAKVEKGGRLRLKILAEAGTYIKELIHSDEGRTKPSLAALLSRKAACDELDVIGIRDYFLETLA
ncbi:MAG: tRNA pseudouridine(54/55) synthase Pus10 [Candidatus Micrarchaeota archaeon]|nr:tRNA pseudouridine(54/55) synthase Pus10 [Candidatus Micrarchaeota archaeon]